MKLINEIVSVCAMMSVCGGMAATAKLGVVVVDADDGHPLRDVKVAGVFVNKAFVPVWDNGPNNNVTYEITDSNGRCTLRGSTNCGTVNCCISEVEGYYKGDFHGDVTFKKTNLLGIWQPDNVVVTIALQRVENPVPLFVKYVDLCGAGKKLEGFDGTNLVASLDMMMGEWLPPHGKGKVADLTINTKLTITGQARKESYPMPLMVKFFVATNTVTIAGRGNGICRKYPNRKNGILIRKADDDVFEESLIFVNGHQKIEHGPDYGSLDSKRFKDYDKDRCYTFRIRSRYNDKGELIDGYYGKIYGDFDFWCNSEVGLDGVSFRYYLNPRSLDRNLETDLEHNLCPDYEGEMPAGTRP